MYIIAGLGNPGKKYENTRHNLGFITLDQVAEKCNIKVEKIKFKSLVGEGIYEGKKIVLIKPQTYMNNSGEAIREAMSFYKEDIENLLVIYDDIDLPTGTVRIRSAGSSGTHNGMRSVIYHLNDDGFPRIRIGIGRDSNIDLVNYVTGGFTQAEVEPLREACLRARDAALCYVSDGIDIAMNRYNIRHSEPKEETSKDKEDDE